MNIKPFKEVKIGDIGIEYGGHKVTVVDKGTVKNMCKKYPWAPGGVPEFLECGCTVDTEVIVVYFESDTDPLIYVYDSDGAYIPIRTYGEKSLALWKHLDTIALPDKESTALLFNHECHKKAEELEMEPIHMNRVVTAWACTLSVKMPEHLSKEPKGFNNG